jgi:RNA polymerase sigma-70 factor (ECF subfamily)
MVEGPESGLAAIAGIADSDALRGYPLLDSVRGELCRRAGRLEEARAHLERALARAGTLPTRRFLERRLRSL